MCFLKAGGTALERVCPVVRHDSSPEHDDGVVLTVMSDPPMHDRSAVKNISLDGTRRVELEIADVPGDVEDRGSALGSREQLTCDGYASSVCEGELHRVSCAGCRARWAGCGAST